MASIRDKLKALYAERPTALPEGAPTEAAPEDAQAAPLSGVTTPARERTRPKPATQNPKPTTQRPKPVQSPERAAQRPKPAPPSPKRASDPRHKPDRPTPPARRSQPAADPRRPHVQTLGHTHATVVRASDFEAWKQRRNTILEERIEPRAEPGTEPRAEPGTEPQPELHAPSARTKAPVAYTPEDQVRLAKLAHDAGQADKARALLEAALDAGLHGPHWWRAARTLAELYVKAGHREQAIGTLELLVAEPNADPYPYLALSELLRTEDPERADTLMARARSIAPWL